MIDLKDIKINNFKLVKHATLRYKNYMVMTYRDGIGNAKYYPRFVASDNEEGGLLYTYKYYAIPKRHKEIAMEMLNLFESLILIPAALEGSNFKLSIERRK